MSDDFQHLNSVYRLELLVTLLKYSHFVYTWNVSDKNLALSRYVIYVSMHADIVY